MAFEGEVEGENPEDSGLDAESHEDQITVTSKVSSDIKADGFGDTVMSVSFAEASSTDDFLQDEGDQRILFDESDSDQQTMLF